ncbi:MAG: FTR1 family protein [Candidatus Bathyarchaeia archaeon]
MIGQYLITFREVFEAALILSIILSYLIKTKRHLLTRYVWYGVYLAIVASSIIGVATWFLYGFLSKSTQLLFETITAFTAVLVLSSMIYWMTIKGKNIKKEMEQRIEKVVAKGTIFSLVLIAFIVVFREGLETVLFLTPFLIEDKAGTIIGLSMGIAIALGFSYSVFTIGAKIDVHKFFYFTSILLILLGGGLAGYGVHELLEYYEEIGINAGWLGEVAYSLNISKENPLHHNNVIGSIFAVMFGYAVKAEWARVIVHLAYLAIAFTIFYRTSRMRYLRKWSELIEQNDYLKFKIWQIKAVNLKLALRGY